MSRSYRKTPIVGIAKSENVRWYKQLRASTERTLERMLLRKASLEDENAAADLSVEQEPWNEWNSPRDGKQWIGNRYPKLLRK